MYIAVQLKGKSSMSGTAHVDARDVTGGHILAAEVDSDKGHYMTHKTSKR
jgi:hypothetical protein